MVADWEEAPFVEGIPEGQVALVAVYLPWVAIAEGGMAGLVAQVESVVKAVAVDNSEDPGGSDRGQASASRNYRRQDLVQDQKPSFRP